MTLLLLLSSAGAQHPDFSRFSGKMPWRYRYYLPVCLADTFHYANAHLYPAQMDWQGVPLKSISDPQQKKSGIEYWAQFKFPIGGNATLYAVRWQYQRSFVRGVAAQVFDNETGRLLWQGDLASVDGGDGGGVERSTTLHDIDRDGYADLIVCEQTWGGYADEIVERTGDEQAPYRYWVMRWNENGYDSVPLRNTPLLRSTFPQSLDTLYALHELTALPLDCVRVLTGGVLPQQPQQQPKEAFLIFPYPLLSMRHRTFYRGDWLLDYVVQGPHHHVYRNGAYRITWTSRKLPQLLAARQILRPSLRRRTHLVFEEDCKEVEIPGHFSLDPPTFYYDCDCRE